MKWYHALPALVLLPGCEFMRAAGQTVAENKEVIVEAVGEVVEQAASSIINWFLGSVGVGGAAFATHKTLKVRKAKRSADQSPSVPDKP